MRIRTDIIDHDTVTASFAIGFEKTGFDKLDKLLLGQKCVGIVGCIRPLTCLISCEKWFVGGPPLGVIAWETATILCHERLYVAEL